MNKPENINKRIDDTLNSLDGIQKAEPNPYFFTRLKARLERDEKSIFERIGVFIARPVVAVSGLCLVLLLNGYILIQNNNTSESSSGPMATNSGRQAPEEDYIFAVATSYDYENNLEP